MKINAAGYASDGATPEEIRELVSDDRKRGEFMILEKGEDDFVQIAGEVASAGFDLEYRESGRMFRCTRTVSRNEAENAFLEYLAGLDHWKSRLPWEPLEFASRPPGRIVVAIVVVALAVIAYFAVRYFCQ